MTCLLNPNLSSKYPGKLVELTSNFAIVWSTSIMDLMIALSPVCINFVKKMIFETRKVIPKVYVQLFLINQYLPPILFFQVFTFF